MKKSSLLQKMEVAPVLLLLINWLGQKWLARTRDFKNAASIYHHYNTDVRAKIAKSNCKKTLSLMDIKLGCMHKTLNIIEANISGFTVGCDI